MRARRAIGRQPMDKEFNPRITALLCKWCSYTGADLAGTSRLQYAPSGSTPFY